MAFATAPELAAYLGHELANEAQAELALTLATGIIQSETGQTIERVTDDVVTLRGGPYGELTLPERPVVTVSSVAGELVREDEWVWQGGTLFRRYGWPEVVVVTYTHGYETVPLDVKAITLAVAARVLAQNAADNAGNIKRETVGAYSVEYQQTNGSGLLTEGERAHLRRAYRPSVGMVALR